MASEPQAATWKWRGSLRSQATYAIDWWAHHRPLWLLLPCENRTETFCGCRQLVSQDPIGALTQVRRRGQATTQRSSTVVRRGWTLRTTGMWSRAFLAAVLPALGVARSIGGGNKLFWDTAQIVAHHGYPVEEHEVNTEDGYRLTVFRIPRGRNGTQGGSRGPAILQHGLLSMSDQWVLQGDEDSLGFLLADRGFDVWLANVRGNRYGRRHRTLSPRDSAFWQFSFHEMGMYDLPAIIDYVLDTTKRANTIYVGHSMGNSILFVTCAMRPEYNEKVRLGVALAPVAFLGGIRQPLLRLALPFLDQISKSFEEHGLKELLPYSRSTLSLIDAFCRQGSITQEVCAVLMCLNYGINYQQIDKSSLSFQLTHLIGGTSTKTMGHLGQLAATNEFCLFDNKEAKNRLMYGTSEVPHYNLTKVTVPMALYYSLNDWLVNPKGITRLSKTLPNVIRMFKPTDARFNHINFVLAKDVKTLLYDNVCELLDGTLKNS